MSLIPLLVRDKRMDIFRYRCLHSPIRSKNSTERRSCLLRKDTCSGSYTGNGRTGRAINSDLPGDALFHQRMKRKRKSLHKCCDVERRQGIENCNRDRKLAKTVFTEDLTYTAVTFRRTASWRVALNVSLKNSVWLHSCMKKVFMQCRREAECSDFN